MKVHILGTRGEIEESVPYHSKKSGILIDGKLLLDCGDECFLDYDPEAIIITHLHPDHAYFVRHNQIPQCDSPIYAPEKYDDVVTVVAKQFKVDSYTITPIPTVHSIKVKSQAYLIEHAGKRLLYTGDMIWIEKKYHHLLGHIDAVITEASYLRKGGMVRRTVEGQLYGHTGVPNLIQFFKPYTKIMLFVHFGAWFYKDSARARKTFKRLAHEHDIQLIVGYDGLKITL